MVAGAGGPSAGTPGWRASLIRNAAATTTHAATAIHNTNRATGSMNGRRAALPNVNVATLYMPRGKTTLHSVGSYVSGQCYRTCRHRPSTTSSGIHQVPNAHRA